MEVDGPKVQTFLKSGLIIDSDPGAMMCPTRLFRSSAGSAAMVIPWGAGSQLLNLGCSQQGRRLVM